MAREHVTEGTRATCRNCGEGVVFTEPVDTFIRERDGLKAKRFSSGKWWHIPGKDFDWQEERFNHGRTNYAGRYVAHASRYGELLSACKPNEAPQRERLTDSTGKMREDKFVSPTSASPREFCMESVDGGSYYSSSTCHRPVKDEELLMCGIHASHEHKRRKGQEEFNSKMDMNQAIVRALGPIIDELNDLWDLDAEIEYKGYGYSSGSYTGKIIVNPGRLVEILNEKVETFDAPDD